LNSPIVRINAVHTGVRARKADSDVAKDLEPFLLLSRGSRVMFRTNLWTEASLINSSVSIIQKIIFKENQSPPSHSLPIAVMMEFDNYSDSVILAADGKKLILIMLVRHTWKGKKSPCSHLQIPLCLAWTITVYKSQSLTLEKAVIDLGRKEFAAGLSFVTISQVPTLNNILFSLFSLERLYRIKNCKRLHERIAEENRLIFMILQNDC